MKILSLIPPMTQLNTPYPSTAYLTGFLRSQDFDAVQEDLALALVLGFFTPEGLAEIQNTALQLPEENRSASVNFFLDYFSDYQNSIALAIRFLQGRDSTLAHRINSRALLPEGPRFASLDAYDEEEGGDSLAWAFGALGSQDRARHLATLYLNDLSDVLRDAVDERFEFVRYAESLAGSQPTFTPLADALAVSPTLMDSHLQALTQLVIDKHQPSLVLLSVPFPGAMYAALRIAQTIKLHYPAIKIGLGGGYVNTELRELTEPRIFDFVDYITLDSGERPLLALIEHLNGKRSAERLVRTFIRNANTVVRYINWQEPDVPFENVGTATWDGLPLNSYLSLLDMLNPMHRLWSDGRWNKLTVAHGCYWKKCSFCDVSLDYIARYETASASLLVDRIEAIVAETGQTGFHFVDEAAPPKILKALAEELIRRKVIISWWGNIRFEKTFTPELSELLAQSGCIAMSGGLEVASDRLLDLMKKGVSVEQVAQVTKGFSDAGILVHAYLMYGFPTQTVQETVDALEYVRQFFENGCIQSGFFHRFTCTVHSPVGKDPRDYGISLVPLPEISFAKNDVAFIDPSGVDHDLLGLGLKKAIYNFMHGVGFEQEVDTWFEMPDIPKATVPRNKIGKILRLI
ncbi:radical SAM protein [Polynucleobacter sp. CS-Odin-A6]|uniref:B12-binding domain-containing radical SAM protein n=1 Tax=Polynucleobacter sp. CS-Odin-A6 TaxID=2689106 RepID=UPI001C0BCEAE|nr:B12-binding domain-containing radical SAM protein [Polynucleobacter sp. CS-Odin-A6]MBU3620743.1 radical SAM protein [Polynucleobacter sp. CS-Odin-A6]